MDHVLSLGPLVHEPGGQLGHHDPAVVDNLVRQLPEAVTHLTAALNHLYQLPLR